MPATTAVPSDGEQVDDDGNTSSRSSSPTPSPQPTGTGMLAVLTATTGAGARAGAYAALTADHAAVAALPPPTPSTNDDDDDDDDADVQDDEDEATILVGASTHDKPQKWVELATLSPGEAASTTGTGSGATRPAPQGNGIWSEINASLWSRLWFTWLYPLLKLGASRPLTPEDIEPLGTPYSVQLNLERFRAAWAKPNRPRLMLLYLWLYRWEIGIGGITRLFAEFAAFTAPLILRSLLMVLAAPTTDLQYLIGLVVILVVGDFIRFTCTHHFAHQGVQASVKAYGLTIAAVYQHAMSLRPYALRELGLGYVDSLASSDADAVREFIIFCNFAWIIPTTIIVDVCLLLWVIGAPALVGVAVLALCMGGEVLISRRSIRLHKNAAKAADARVGLVAETVSAIPLLKSYAWERLFRKRVDAARASELTAHWATTWNTTWATILMFCTNIMVLIGIFVTFALTSQTLTTVQAFTTLALLNVLRGPLRMAPRIASLTAQAFVAFGRLEKFFEMEAGNRPRGLADAASPGTPAVVMNQVTAQWSPKSAPVLQNVSFSVPQGALCIIVGPVGAGKSTLLHTLLADTVLTSGTSTVSGPVSYVSQEAFILNASLKDNILFGRPYDEDRYQSVLDATMLRPDIAVLPAGDETLIGERGITLSGGQKQRVSIARAVYGAEPSVVLMDDPLSAVDADTGAAIFNRCVLGLLRNRTRLICLHQLHWVQYADVVVYLADGQVVQQGSYADLMASQSHFSELIGRHMSPTRTIAAIGDGGTGATSPSDAMQDSKVDTPRSATPAEPAGSKPTGAAAKSARQGVAEDRATGIVAWDVWKEYGKASGKAAVAWVIGLSLLVLPSWAGSGLWLAEWTSGRQRYFPANLSQGDRQLFGAGIYAAISIINVLLVSLRSIFAAKAGLQAAQHMHDNMLDTLLHVPMSFFDTNPSGRVLNRFSRDTSVMDTSLPKTLVFVLEYWFNLIGVLGVMAGVQPLSLVGVVPLLVIYHWIQKVYRASSRELKRIDSTARSPVFSHVTETLHGLTTIRAYDAQPRFLKKLASLLDTGLAAYYSNMAINRWLGIRLESLGLGAVICALVAGVATKDVLGPALVGFLLSYTLQVTQMLNWMVRYTADLEVQMTSAERVVAYSRLEREAPWEVPDHTPPPSWPSAGHIKLDHLSLRYRPELPLVLNDLTLEVPAGQKLALCGRTGSGKSSMVRALLRLYEPCGGRIVLDDWDITKIGVHSLRQVVTLIPQDPILLTGTFRTNLDPLAVHADAHLFHLLEEVQLKDAVVSAGGLDATIASGGSNLSVGQRQLMCLARALLRGSKVLVFDEPTASVDMDTDALLQRMLRARFADSTIITIAHRLRTIMDYDRVIVLREGRVAEDGPPYTLATMPEGLFASLVRESNATG